MHTDRRLPASTPRLRFRDLADTDVDDLAAVLGDPETMRFYPSPLTDVEVRGWIDRNVTRYATDGHGLWAIETHDDRFVGDCGLTWQPVNGVRRLEVGYHVRIDLQGRGYATEAAAACLAFARDALRAPEVVSISHPDNVASRRVVEKLGLRRLDDDLDHPTGVRVVLGMRFQTSSDVHQTEGSAPRST